VEAMRDTCERVENKVVVLAASECLRVAAVVDGGSPVGYTLEEVGGEWLRAAHALGGLTLVYLCGGEWGLISRLYLPITLSFREAPGGAGERLLGDRELLRAWARTAMEGGEGLRALEGPLAEPRGYEWRLGGATRLAVAGVECLPPYARRG